MNLLESAQKAVTAATAGGKLHREHAETWYSLKSQAAGEQAEQIGEMAEALVLVADTDDRRWLDALLSGGLKGAAQALMIERMRDEAMQFEAGRGDAAEPDKSPDKSGGLDWGLIARETKEMVRLNEGVGGSDPETEDGEGVKA